MKEGEGFKLRLMMMRVIWVWERRIHTHNTVCWALCSNNNPGISYFHLPPTRSSVVVVVVGWGWIFLLLIACYALALLEVEINDVRQHSVPNSLSSLKI
jgi:hypothetical protein